MTDVKSAWFSRDRFKKHTHYHDAHQLILIKRGRAKLSVNGVRCVAEEKSLIVFSRYENHSIHADSEEYERYVLRIAPSSDRLFSILSNRPEGFSNIIDVSDSFDAFENVFIRLCREADSNDPLHEQMLDTLCRELLIMVYRRMPRLDITPDVAEMVFDVQKNFEENFSSSFSLASLAEKYSVSPSTLSHEFKRVTGVSVMDYLLSCRMAWAKRLLSKTSKSITEIIGECGFSDTSNFSRTFKKLTGFTPTLFRQEYKK